MLTIENTMALIIDFQDRLMPAIHNYQELIVKTAILIEGLKLLGVPIVTTQQYTKGLGATVPELSGAVGGSGYVEKITFSCCKNEEFRGKLAKAGRKDIAVAGVEAHICVQQTVLDLLDHGYNVYIIADCVGSRREMDRLYAERRMERAGAVLTTSEAALFEMMVAADHPARKDISNLVK